MRIRELSIEGFGHFNQRTFGTFDTPIVVLYGPNEGGKSTLLNFIRSTLFGFPTRDRDQHYPPLSGGKHGGRIVVADDSGIEYVIERYVGARGGPVTISGIAGQAYPSAKLSQLLGSATKDVFENAFAFSLDELQTSDLLTDKNINSQIYSAGMGTTNLPALTKKMTADMEKIYRPGGSKPVVNSIASELDGMEVRIREITRNSEQYSALNDSVEKADMEIAESVQRNQELQHRRASLSSLRDAWERWIALLDVEQQLGELPLHKGLAANPMEELEKRESALSIVSGEFNAAQEQLEGAELDADAIQPDGLILEDETLIAEINQRKTSVLHSVKDLPEREAELASLTTILESRLSDLGAGWDRKRLETTDLGSFPVSIEIDGHRTAISNQTQKLLALDSSLTTLKNALTQEENALTQARDKLTGVSQPEYSESELERKKKVATEAEVLRSEYQNAHRAHERLQSLSGIHELSGNRLNTFLMPGTLALAAIVAIVAGTATGQHPIFTYGVGGLLLVVGGLSYLLGRTSSGRRSRLGDIDSELEKTREELEKIEDRLVDSLAEIGLVMEGIDQLDSLREECDGIQVQISQWTSLYDAILGAEKQVEKQSSLVNESEISLQEANTQLDELRSKWKQWLSAKELPSSLTPESMDVYRGQIEAGRGELEAYKVMKSRVSAIKTDIDQYSVLAKPLAEKHGEGLDSDATSLVKAADTLVKRLEEAKGQQIQKKQCSADVAKCEKSLERRKEELEEAKGALNSLLEQAGATDSDAFRIKAQDEVTREELSIQKQKLVHALQILSGPGEEFDAFRTALASTNSSEIELELIQVKERIQDEEERHTGLIGKRAQAHLQIEQLISEDELSTLQVQKSQLQEQLSVYLITWTRFKLADEMLRRGKDKFQEERQPGVIKHAQEFFGDVTNSRYPRLYAPLGEQTVRVEEVSGAQKQPDQLSRGTREQLYLSLRFGLIKEYREHSEALPVIVDEVLVNFDPKRAQRACSAFAELSKTNQVLVFTCHPQIVDGFLEIYSETQVIDVA